jgi:hypothetical protein
MRVDAIFVPKKFRWESVILGLCVLIVASAPVKGQGSKLPATAASYSETYCSGFIAKADLPHLGRVLAAEEGNKKNDLSVGDLIYLGDGPMSGLEKGQEVFIIRPLQKAREVGTLFADIGHVKIVDMNENVFVGQITFSCEPMAVDDWIVAPQTRAMPPARGEVPFDRFARPTGKGDGQIVASRNDLVQLGQGIIVYLNVGLSQGVQPGSTLRIYRPTKEASVNAYNQSKVKKYAKSGRLPRQILGECVVLQAGEHSSTAIITYSLEELIIGDLVELQ